MTYKVEVTREGRWWMVSVPQIDGLTQARRLAEVPLMARELIAVQEGKKLEDVEIEVHYQDIEDVAEIEGRLAKIAREKHQVEKLTRALAIDTAALAKDLVHAAVPLRDVGELLGVSYQRVHQIVAEEPLEDYVVFTAPSSSDVARALAS